MRISDWSSDVCSSDLQAITRADVDASRFRISDSRIPNSESLLHRHHPMCMNQIAASAAMLITSEIVCTKREVVRSPTDCAVPFTGRPSKTGSEACRERVWQYE